MNEITTIIFSKNRACQLELLLRNLSMSSIVLYTHDKEFERGYEKLIKMYPSVKFIKEINFKKQLIENIGEYTMFLCDDDIMIEHFSEDCSEFIEFKQNQDILCLSLRLAPFYNNAPILINNIWEWRGCKTDWGYPMSVTSNIFRKQDILQTIIDRNVTSPHTLERQLKRHIPDRPLMICFDKPKTLNNLVNQVKAEYTNRDLGRDPKDLEDKFINGGLLSLKHIKEKAKETKKCFLKVDYEWK